MAAIVPDLCTVAEMSRTMPVFPEASFRDLIYHSEPRLSARGEPIPPNGFARCIVRIGRRVLIDRAEFVQYLEARRAAPPSRGAA